MDSFYLLLFCFNHPRWVWWHGCQVHGIGLTLWVLSRHGLWPCASFYDVFRIGSYLSSPGTYYALVFFCWIIWHTFCNLFQMHSLKMYLIKKWKMKMRYGLSDFIIQIIHSLLLWPLVLILHWYIVLFTDDMLDN